MINRTLFFSCWPSIFCLCLIIYGSLSSGSNSISKFFFLSDKILHFGSYAVFSVTLCFYHISLSDSKKIRMSRFIFIMLIGTILGASLEICQFYFTSDRIAEWMDLFMNSLGLVLGFLIIHMLNYKSVL